MTRSRIGAYASVFRGSSGTAPPPASIPWSVSDTSVEAFIDYASEVQFTVKPHDLHKQVTRCWNRAQESCSRLAADHPDRSRLPSDSRPPSLGGLRSSASSRTSSAYLSLLGGENLLDEDAPDRACKPSTIKTRRDYLRLAATAAVKAGHGSRRPTLAGGSRLAPSRAADSRALLAKKDGKIVTFTIDMAERLYAIARIYVKAPEEQLQSAGAVLPQAAPTASSRPDGEEHGGDPNIQRSDRTARASRPCRANSSTRPWRSGTRPVQAAVKAEIALAIQIQLVAPMRLANLAALHLEKNVVRVGGPEPTYHLVIPPEDVKNDEPLEYPLPQVVNEMLGIYLAVFRPRLCSR